MASITTREAARRLGTSTRRVRALIAAGDVAASRVGRDYAIEAESLARFGAVRATGRSLSPRISWVALLSDLGTRDLDRVASAAGLSRSEQGRVKALRDRRIEDWGWLARRRATTRRYSVRDAYAARVLSDARVVRSGVSAADEYDVDLTGRRATGEVYVAERDAGPLEHDHLLRPDPAGLLVVHVVDAALLLGRLEGASVMTAATVGVDLMESDDARVRRAGVELLQRITSA